MSRLRLSAVLLVALALPLSARQARPLSAQPSTGIHEAYSKFTLPNGLVVILHEDHTVPTVTVNVWYHVGSANEKPGRTGFAHLFEHLMFMGSGHVKNGEFDTLLEAAGGNNNASTANDRTNYYIDVPSNALDLALFLESDRMGTLLDVVNEAMVNGQRDVVKNERRERVENAPYGMASVRLNELMYPKDHPYHWPVVGYMEDLTAASAEDVRGFFRTYYTPQNASLVVAGDINPLEARRKIEYWFRDVKPGKAPAPIVASPASIPSVIKETVTDRVQLPRLTLAWHSPAIYKPGDAELDTLADLLTSGKTSRLYKKLVYDMQVAQSVSANQGSQRLGSVFEIMVTARPSQDPPDKVLERLKALIDEELDAMRKTPPDAKELQRAFNKREASFYSRLERVGGVADQLNGYFFSTGDPDYFAKDLARYKAVTPAAVQAALTQWLNPAHRLELSVVPAGAAK